MKLDKKDILLLNELQKDCKQNLKKLSRKLNMSITTVYDRMKKLEKNGVIKGYKAILDPKKTGNSASAYIFIKTETFTSDSGEPLSQSEIGNKLAKLPEVSEVYIIPGEFDFLIKIRGKDIDEIANFVIEKLRKMKDINRTFTTDVWVTIKECKDLRLRIE